MIRGNRNPFPEKTKPTTNVFSTPQKMDPPPASLKEARKTADYAMVNHDPKHPNANGSSAASVRAYAMRGPGRRKRV